MKTYSAEEKHAGTLALRIAQFARDVDPYEFMDQMGTTETQHDAIIRTAKGIYNDIISGQADGLIDFLMEYDLDEDDPLEFRRYNIVSELRDFSSSKTISKNLFKTINRRNEGDEDTSYNRKSRSMKRSAPKKAPAKKKSAPKKARR